MPRKTYRFFGHYRRQAHLDPVQPIQLADGNTEDEFSDHDEIGDEAMSSDQPERASSDTEMADVNEGFHGGSELGEVLKTTSTRVLCFLTSACISRFSERDFNRFLSCHSPRFRDEAMALWNFKKGQYSVLHFCNSCGVATNSMENCVCGGVVQKITRVHLNEKHFQLADRDPFFPLYTPPTTLVKKTSYVVLDQEIVDVLAEILSAGFELEDNDENKQVLLTHIPQSMYYFFDKLRQQFNKYHGPGSSIASANDFRDQMNTSPNFRTNRRGVYVNYLHDDEQDSYNGQDGEEQPSTSGTIYPQYLNL